MTTLWSLVYAAQPDAKVVRRSHKRRVSQKNENFLIREWLGGAQRNKTRRFFAMMSGFIGAADPMVNIG